MLTAGAMTVACGVSNKNVTFVVTCFAWAWKTDNLETIKLKDRPM